jgi:uncharacterized protein YcfJ
MYAKRFLRATGDLKSKDAHQILSESTKGAVVGTAIGAGLGLVIGFSRKKNLLLSAVIGGFVGAAISKVMIKKG